MTRRWPTQGFRMPEVQKMEAVWFGMGQALSGESTNCSKLTFASPGGKKTGDRPGFNLVTIQIPSPRTRTHNCQLLLLYVVCILIRC